MAIVDFNKNDLKVLKRIGIKYEDSDGTSHIADANIIFISDNNLTVSFSDRAGFDLSSMQPVVLKYVFNNMLCDAETTLSDVKKANGLTYLIINYPKTVTQINRRKYFRIKLERTCVLNCTYEDGRSDSYISRLVDISLGGVFFHKLESMYSDNYVKIDPSVYKSYNIVVFLDVDIVLKIPARYIRQEKGRVSYRYAFEFLEIKKASAEKLSQYLTKEQIRQHKLQDKA